MSPFWGRKVEDQSYMGPVNFQTGSALLLLTRNLQQRCWLGFNTVTVGFPNVAVWQQNHCLGFPECVHARARDYCYFQGLTTLR